MLVKFEQNRMVQLTRNFELFDQNKQTNKQKKKTGVFITIFDNALAPFWKRFLKVK